MNILGSQHHQGGLLYFGVRSTPVSERSEHPIECLALFKRTIKRLRDILRRGHETVENCRNVGRNVGDSRKLRWEIKRYFVGELNRHFSPSS